MNNNKKFFSLLLKTLILYILFELFLQFVFPYVLQIVWNSLRFGKYTRYFVAEAAAALVAVVIIFIKKDWHIFKFNKKSFFKGIKLGGPIIIISILFFFTNGIFLLTNLTSTYQNLLSLLLFSIFIGIFEEVFFRGTIQKYLTDNYSSNYKELLTSIICSSLIFGMSHITNAFAGQTMFSTIMQVLQSFSIGMILSTIYFTTKNLWSVIFLHGFYDFSLMLTYVTTLKDCTFQNNIGVLPALSSIGTTLVLVIVNLTYVYVMLQKSRINPLYDIRVSDELLTNDKKKRDKVITFAIVTASVLFAVSNFITFLTNSDDKNYVCYEYEKINIQEYSTTFDNFDNYKISLLDGYGKQIEYKIYLKDKKIHILNSLTLEESELHIENIHSLIVYKSEKGINILALGLDKSDYIVYYSNYLNDYYTNIEELKRSFKYYVIPDSNAIGYLTDTTNNEIYPLIRIYTYDNLIIKDNDVYVVER